MYMLVPNIPACWIELAHGTNSMLKYSRYYLSKTEQFNHEGAVMVMFGVPAAASLVKDKVRYYNSPSPYCVK